MTFPELGLDGRVALVTGGGRGIAGGVARVLAEAGAGVALNARTATYAAPLAADIARATGRRVEVFPADMTDPASVEATVAAVLGAFGRIDILVNGVGDAIASPLVPLPDTAARGRPAVLAQGDAEPRAQAARARRAPAPPAPRPHARDLVAVAPQPYQHGDGGRVHTQMLRSGPTSRSRARRRR